MDNPDAKPPRKDSWESFRPIGDELEAHRRKDSLAGWICVVALLSLATITIVPLLVVIGLHVATGGYFLTARTGGYVNTDKLTIFGDRQSRLVFIYALGVWWVTKTLAEPVRAQYGINTAWLARFAMACVANAPAVWLMKHRLDRRERAEAAERQALQEAKRRQAEALLNWRDDEGKTKEE